MASGVIVGSTNISGLGARLKWRSTPDRTNNTSTLTLILELNNNSSQTWQMSGTWHFSVDGGTPIDRSDTVTIPQNSGWVEAVGKGGIVIQHGSDGSKVVSLAVSGGWQGMSTSISGSADLGTIAPVVSPITVDSVSPLEIRARETLSIAFTRPAGTVYADLWLSLRSSSVTISLDSATSPYTWTLPAGWVSGMASGSREWATARIITYEDSAHTVEAGRSERIWYAVAEALPPSPETGWLAIYPRYVGASAPTGWDNAVYSDPAPGSPGVLLSGVCGLRVVIDDNQISDIIDWAETSVTVAGVRYYFSSTGVTGIYAALTGALTAGGTITAAVTLVTMGGGRYSEQVDVDCIAYTAPSLLSPSAFRSTSAGVADDNGGYIYAAAAALHTTITRGVQDINAASLQLRYKLTTGSWPVTDTWEDLTPTGEEFPNHTGQEVPLSADSAYDVQIRAKDGLGIASTWSTIIPARAVFLHALTGNTGVGLGRRSGKGAGWLDTAWSIHSDGDGEFLGDLRVTGNIFAGGGLPGLQIRTGQVSLIQSVEETVVWTTPMTGAPVVLIANQQVVVASLTLTTDTVGGATVYTGFKATGAYGSAGSETVKYLALYWGGTQ